MRTNLVEAFGGDTTVFAALKVTDTKGIGASDADGHGGTIQSRGMEAAIHAARHVGVARPEHMIITEEAELPNQRKSLCWPSYVPPGRPTDVYMSIAGQLANRQACHDLIEAEEERTGKMFDVVISTRPDMSWPVAMKPYCMFDLNTNYMQWDWAFLFTRDQARTSMDSVPEELWTCARMPAENPHCRKMSSSRRRTLRSVRRRRCHASDGSFPGVSDSSLGAQHGTRWLQLVSSGRGRRRLHADVPCESMYKP